MDFLGNFSGILNKSYFVATLLNIILTFLIVKGNFKKIQDRISIVFLISLILLHVQYILNIFYGWDIVILLSELWSPSEGSRYSFWGYRLMWIYPTILMPLFLIKRIRTSIIVIIVSLIFFYPIIFEFITILITSNIPILELNTSYTYPILKMIISGVVLYGILISLELVKTKKESILDEFVSD